MSRSRGSYACPTTPRRAVAPAVQPEARKHRGERFDRCELLRERRAAQRRRREGGRHWRSRRAANPAARRRRDAGPRAHASVERGQGAGADPLARRDGGCAGRAGNRETLPGRKANRQRRALAEFLDRCRVGKCRHRRTSDSLCRTDGRRQPRPPGARTRVCGPAVDAARHQGALSTNQGPTSGQPGRTSPRVRTWLGPAA